LPHFPDNDILISGSLWLEAITLLSRSGIHAVRALVALASLPEGEFKGAAALAEETGAPPNYLGKLLQALSRDGLVKSQKGLGGGFRLAQPAEKIRMYDIIHSLEDVHRWTRCVFGMECTEETPCALHDRWVAIRESYMDMLKSTRLVDLTPTFEHRGVKLPVR
jgi:Rrf2 family protein